MTPLRKKIMVGAIGYIGVFLTSVTTYLTGIRDQGGTWQDVDGVSIGLFALLAISGGVSALGALLAKSPNEDTAVQNNELETLFSEKDYNDNSATKAGNQ